MKLNKNQKLVIVTILLIILIGSFFRLWQLETIPPGLYPDEAINATNALSAIKTGEFKVFYPDNHGREGLYINLLAFSFSIFGISLWSLKFVGALIGILTILGLFLLTKELFNKNIALLSSFFLAISFWHINFSRIGFRGILVPFVLTFLFYFLFKGFKTKKLSNFLIAGLFLGIGFHTYISFRFVVLLIALILLLWFLIYKKEKLQKKFFLLVAAFLLVAFLAALPIGIYFLQNQGDFISRATGVSVFSADNPIISFAKSLGAHLAMFNFYGDPNWRHNFGESPQLFWPVGILFLIGFFLSLKRLALSLKNKDHLSFTAYSLLFSWFFIFLLPGALTYEGIPHALRTIGVIPVAYIFAGIGAWFVYEKLKRTIKYKKAFVLCLITILVLIAGFQFSKYFLSWAEKPEVNGAFSRDYFEIGNYLNSLSPTVQKYIIVNEIGVPFYGLSIPAQVPMFIESTAYSRPRAEYIPVQDINQIELGEKETVIIPLYRNGMEQKLKQAFPQGEIEDKQGFWVYIIK